MTSWRVINMSAAAKTRPEDSRHTLAMQQAALQGQIDKLAREMADATANRNRAIAAATLEASKANLATKDQATGIVVRLEAELAAVRSALATVEADAAKLDEAKRIAVEAQRLKAAAKALADATVAASKADEAAAAFAENLAALKQAIVNASVATPADLRNQVFGHDLLGEQSLKATATWLLAKTGVVARPLFEPSDYRQTLAALVERFGLPVTDAAKAAVTPPKPTEWED
ncbi:MAG: hypothetical protein Q8O26_02890 [Phreatobacter sp.]|uniref:hypothetical protein n=1 Tax=Phreatobacter sp. TaxID=1966341 RepID=UPI0027331684|nr:hypothetical protein [Phreatobacter sp.]MDP2800807.1 hypothetical protein [Phreatobacter sp.]